MKTWKVVTLVLAAWVTSIIFNGVMLTYDDATRPDPRTFGVCYHQTLGLSRPIIEAGNVVSCPVGQFVPTTPTYGSYR